MYAPPPRRPEPLPLGDPRPQPPPPDSDAPSPPRFGPEDDGGLPEPTPPRRPAPTPPASAPASATPRPRRPVFSGPALKRPTGGDGASGPAALRRSEGPAQGDGQSGAAPGAPADPLGPALARLTEAWPRVIAAVRERVGVRVGAILQSSAPVRVARGAVEIGMDDAFGVTVATNNEAALLDVLSDVLRSEVPPLRWVESARDTPETVRADDPFETLKQMRQDHPVVRALFDQFGAEIVWN